MSNYNLTLGTVKKSKKGDKYYQQHYKDSLKVFTEDEEFSLESGKFLSVVDSEDKFIEFEIVKFIKNEGEDVAEKYKKAKVLNIVKKKDGNMAIKVACDRLELVREGEKILFEKGDWLNLQDKDDKLNRAAYRLEQGWITEEEYNVQVERIEKMPDYVIADVIGKGKVL